MVWKRRLQKPAASAPSRSCPPGSVPDEPESVSDGILHPRDDVSVATVAIDAHGGRWSFWLVFFRYGDVPFDGLPNVLRVMQEKPT